VVDEAAMKTRTSIILGVVALGLALFIYFYERNLPSTEELESRSGRMLPGFDRDRVDRLVLGTGEDRVELLRETSDEPDAGPTGAVGDWRLTHPMELEADPEAVDSLLSAIDWLERRRSFEEEGAAKAAKFGLADPRASISLRLRGRDISLAVGGEAPGEGIYVAFGDEANKVYVVDHEFLEQITKEPGDLRNKRLADLRVRDTKAIRVAGRFHALRQGADRWVLETPLSIRADRRRVEDVVRNLEQLRAARFVADGVSDDDLERYGLDQPRREVTLRVEGQSEAVVLRFGGVCEGHGDEVYATSLGTGTVSCVDQDILEELAVAVDSLRDLRPTALAEEDIQRITLERGEARLELSQGPGGWRIGAASAAPADAGPGEGREADDETVEAFIEALRSVSASDVTSDLSAVGLADGAASGGVIVRLFTESDGGDEAEAAEVLTFATEGSGVFLRRSGESVALVLPASFASELQVDPLRFRGRQVVSERASDATELELTGPAGRQLLRREESRWRVVEPLELAADDVVAQEIARSVARLEVERFVAAAARPEHGLARPRIELRLRFVADDGDEADAGAASPVDHTILIGAEAEGGRYARLAGDDQPVFVVAAAFVERLEGPLLDRDLFMLEDERVTGLVIERPGAERVEIERSEDGWRTGTGPAPEGAVAAILSRFGTARAAEVLGFGAPTAAMGLAAPRARLRVALTSEGDEERSEERVMLIGAEYGDEGSRRVYMRREDVDATFGMPARVVAPLLEWGVSSEAAEADDDASPEADEVVEG
jgi:hypothetical protein